MSSVDADPLALDVREISAGYGEALVVEDVSLRVRERGIVAIIGPNGAGKSTFLKAIYGVLKPRSGSVHVRVDGDVRDVTALPAFRLTRSGLGYVPQLENVFPNLSVIENLEVAAIPFSGPRGPRIDDALGFFPALQGRRRQRAGTLSGGERKMLAPAAVDDVFAKLVEINAAGIAIMMVEQNARRALALADYGYVLDGGRNRYEGPADGLLDDPKVVELYLGGARHETR